MNLVAEVFETGATTDYTVSSVTYAPPFPFSGGTQIFINQDDIWSDVINLPFNFCFYGNQYDQIVIGANGVLTFDVSLANQACEWQFTASIPTPGPPNVGIYNNSINGAYHDMDPRATLFFSPDINYAVLGVAPCRSFVVNYNEVEHYNCTSFPPFVSGLASTQQIVLYETTNVVEVYIDDKPVCSGWNGGNAVIGLQNIDGTQGITPPGRNTGAWSASNEAWQFNPSGASITSVNWYDANRNLLATGPSLNVCPTSTETYIAEGVYDRCDGTQILVEDQVTLTVTNGFISTPTITDESCTGTCDGVINIAASGGTPPFSFDIGNGPQISGDFAGLCAGNYTVSISDAGGCTGSSDFIIQSGAAFTVTEVATDETCQGASDGTITLTASGGAAPYTYNIGVGPTNTTGSFTGQTANTYNYTVTDNSGCALTGTVQIRSGAALNVNETVADEVCLGANDGGAQLTAGGGTAPYTYDIGVVLPNTTGTFSGLAATTYNYTITDNSGCTLTGSFTVNAGPVCCNMTNTVASTPPSCNTCDGTITLTESMGVAPVQFSIDNGVTFQASGIFTGQCAGNYDILIEDAGGCQYTDQVTLAAPNSATLTSTITGASCAGASDGAIDLIVTGGVGPFTYSWSSSDIAEDISGVASGNYSVTVADANGCSISETYTVDEPTAITVQAIPADVSCEGQSDGAIDITANGGQGGFTYNWSTGPTSEDLSALVAGSYVLTVTDLAGCIFTTSYDIIEPQGLDLQFTITHASCGDDNGQVSLSISGGAGGYTYNWSDNSSQPDLIGLTSGNYAVTVTDANGCSVVDDFDIDDTSPLIVDAGPDDSLAIGDTIVLSPIVSDEDQIASVTWSPSISTSCSDCLRPEAFPLVTTAYDLTIVDIFDCTYSDQVVINVVSNQNVYVPNAFSPNGDGYNDLFVVQGTEIASVEMKVFDRWGEKVFEGITPNDVWNGMYKDKVVRPGVFIYCVDVTFLTGEQEVEWGSLTVIK